MGETKLFAITPHVGKSVVLSEGSLKLTDMRNNGNRFSLSHYIASILPFY